MFVGGGGHELDSAQGWHDLQIVLRKVCVVRARLRVLLADGPLLCDYLLDCYCEAHGEIDDEFKAAGFLSAASVGFASPTAFVRGDPGSSADSYINFISV